MPRALPALLALLVACSGGDGPVRSAANTAPASSPAVPVVDPAELLPSAGPGLRWRTAASGSGSVSSQAGEPRAEGAFVFNATTVTLENKTAARLSGPIELVLPRGTFAAVSGDGATSALLDELRVPERDGRVFETAALELAPGEKRVVVIEHAALASGAPESPSAVSPRAAAPRSVAFLIDTSLARTHQLVRELEVATAYARSLAPNTALLVGAYDSSVAPLYEGRAADFGPEIVAKLKARGTASTSNVARAIEWATRPRADAAAADRLILVSDGLDGLDEIASAAISRTLRDTAATELRIDVLVPAGPSDDVALRALARELAPKPGALIALEDDTATGRLLAAPPGEATSVDPRRRARDLIERDKLTVPAWVTSDLARARETPAAKSWERIPAFAKSLRPFPTSVEQRNDVDPMEEYKEGPKPAVDPVTVTFSDAPKSSSKTASKPEERPQIPPETIRQIVRRNFAPLRFCYREALRKDPKAGGKLTIRFDIDETGAVPLARAAESGVGPELTACFVRAFEALSFPASPSGTVTVSYPFTLAKSDANGDLGVPPTSAKPRSAVTVPAQAQPDKEPWAGSAKLVYEALERGDSVHAIEAARAVVRESPRDLQGHLLLGDALAAAGDIDGATRSYGSLVELAPRDAGALRIAGGRFASLGPKAASADAERCLTRALELEPSGAGTYHMLALLLAQRGAHESALGVLDQALASEAGRAPATRELLRRDLTAIGGALVAADPSRTGSVRSWLARVGASLSSEPALSIVASWEGAGDVDLTVRDRSLSIAQEGTPNLPAGGRVLAESGQRGGPETFTLDQSSRNYPYVPALVSKHGTAAFVTGTLFRSETNSRGGFVMDARPFFINVDGGRFEAPALEGPLVR